MWTAPVRAISSAGSPPLPRRSTPSTAVVLQTVLILDIAHLNLFPFLEKVGRSTSTALLQPLSTTLFKDAARTGIASSARILRGTSAAVWSQTFGCRTCVPHNRPISCRWSWLAIIVPAIRMLEAERLRAVRTTRPVSIPAPTTASSVVGCNWAVERPKAKDQWAAFVKAVLCDFAAPSLPVFVKYPLWFQLLSILLLKAHMFVIC